MTHQLKTGHPPTDNAHGYKPLDCGPPPAELNPTDVIQRLLENHQTMDPHHEELCRLCIDATAVLNGGGL